MVNLRYSMECSMNHPKTDLLAPVWQRAVCAVFAAAGLFPLIFWLITMFDEREIAIQSLVWPLGLGVWGCVLFGHAAVTGRLPRFMRSPRAVVGKSDSTSKQKP